jgi:hypothetical protein
LNDGAVGCHPPEACADKNGEEKDFGGGEEIADAGSGFHAQVVCCCEHAYQDRQDGQAIRGLCRLREDLTQIGGEEVGGAGACGDPGKPGHPGDLDAPEAPQGFAGVQIGTAGLVELGGYFAQAAGDDRHSRASYQVGQRSHSAEAPRNY